MPENGNALDISLLPDSARIKNGRLSIAGVDLLDLASQYGTPLFVYDEQYLRDRCKEAVSAWGEGVAYASKAFLSKAMARLAYEEGMSLDVSTGGELHVALAGGVPAENLVLHGNNKSDQELITALEVGVGRIVVDSFDEIDRLVSLAKNYPPPKVLVRVTPGVEAHTHEYIMTGQQDSKFGFGFASGEARQAVERLQQCASVELYGIHCHIGSQIFMLDSFVKAVDILADFIKEFALPEFCIGGGLGVAYVEGEKAPSITEWAFAVKDACAKHNIPSSIKITAEPGRSIVATAGITLYTVGTIKKIPNIRTFVSVDGGMSDNPRPVLYGSGYEVFLPREVDAPRPMKTTVVGKHCESGDIIVKDAQVPDDLAVGDILATPVTGAYGFSMASNYNRLPRPPIVFVKDGQARLVVRRETFDDLLRNEV